MKLSQVAGVTDDRLRHHLGEARPTLRFGGQELVLQTEGVPEWWTSRGNSLYTEKAPARVSLQAHPGLPPPTNSMVILGAACVEPDTILLWGECPLVVLGRGCQLPGGVINCGGGSSVILGEGISCTHIPTLNARNGGLISIDGDGLWSSRVTIFTDDMHAILDAETGQRLNKFGGCVRVERHVWLGFEVMLLPGAVIGHDSVIGARALVNGPLPPNSVCVGSPARPVRSGVTWSREDLAPSAIGAGGLRPIRRWVRRHFIFS